MRLPFTESEFLDVFAAYNGALWPAALAWWLLSLVALAAVLRGRARGPAVPTLMAGLWAWSGVAYHFGFFTRINPAARVFGALFLVQAALVIWVGRREPPRLVPGRSPRQIVGVLLAAYGLVYPLLAVVLVGPYPRIPTFGVPCPTTLFTSGLLILVTPPRRSLLVIPLLWSLIGGSAAILLGVTTDFALLAAAAVLLAFLVSPRLLETGHTT